MICLSFHATAPSRFHSKVCGALRRRLHHIARAFNARFLSLLNLPGTLSHDPRGLVFGEACQLTGYVACHVGFKMARAEQFGIVQSALTFTRTVFGPHGLFSFSTKGPGLSVVFLHFYTQGSIEWRQSFLHYCPHSKLLQNVASDSFQNN